MVTVYLAMKLHKAAAAFGACCALFALAGFSPAAWSQAGYVHEISGLISIQRVAAKAAPAKVGDTFESDTVFRTGADAKVTLKFADGQVVAVGANSALRVGQYSYTPGNLRQNNSTVELLKGEMRLVTGLIGATNPDGARIIAGDTLLRVLSAGGADFTVAVNPEPKEVGAAVVARGEISARTPYGQISRISAGQYAPWEPGRSPPPPRPFAAAPAVVQASAAALWATVLPASAPVAVASAAQTAGAIAAASQTATAAGADARLAGYVEAVSNSVSIKTNSGKATAGAGTTFQAGATFSTGTDGRAVLKFADGQIVVLGPSSVLAIDQYRFDPGNLKASKSALDLSEGAMRVITGYIHAEHHEGVSISAGASIVDILNTGPADFTVAVNTKDQEVGVARVTLGEISVHTPYGPIDKIKIDQSSLWGPRKTPTSPIPVAAALAVVQAAVTLQQVQALPDSTPVTVAAAARAAAAVAEANRAQALASANPRDAQLQAAARAATELASALAQAAAATSEAVAAKVLAARMDSLPPTSAGPALAQVAATPAPVSPIAPPAPPAVTPGGGGTCLGSPC